MYLNKIAISFMNTARQIKQTKLYKTKNLCFGMNSFKILSIEGELLKLEG